MVKVRWVQLVFGSKTRSPGAMRNGLLAAQNAVGDFGVDIAVLGYWNN